MVKINKEKTVKIIICIIVFIYFICITLIVLHESCYKTKIDKNEINITRDAKKLYQI